MWGGNVNSSLGGSGQSEAVSNPSPESHSLVGLEKRAAETSSAGPVTGMYPTGSDHGGSSQSDGTSLVNSSALNLPRRNDGSSLTHDNMDTTSVPPTDNLQNQSSNNHSEAPANNVPQLSASALAQFAALSQQSYSSGEHMEAMSSALQQQLNTIQNANMNEHSSGLPPANSNATSVSSSSSSSLSPPTLSGPNTSIPNISSLPPLLQSLHNSLNFNNNMTSLHSDKKHPLLADSNKAPDMSDPPSDSTSPAELPSLMESKPTLQQLNQAKLQSESITSKNNESPTLNGSPSTSSPSCPTSVMSTLSANTTSSTATTTTNSAISDSTPLPQNGGAVSSEEDFSSPLQYNRSSAPDAPVSEGPVIKNDNNSNALGELSARASDSPTPAAVEHKMVSLGTHNQILKQ